MTIHKEGTPTILLSAIFFAAVNFGIYHFAGVSTGLYIALVFSVAIWLFLISFFRIPAITIDKNTGHIIAPADGKVVVIEETEEVEYFKDKRIQVSIFMSPLNVHVNRAPMAGKVSYDKYHPGKYLVAWHPKSSTENERNTIVFDNGKVEVLCRQIAGKLARKIVAFSHTGDQLDQGDQFGFIKFGSRVDVFLPLDAKVKVELGQKSFGGRTVIAELPK